MNFQCARVLYKFPYLSILAPVSQALEGKRRDRKLASKQQTKRKKKKRKKEKKKKKKRKKKEKKRKKKKKEKKRKRKRKRKRKKSKLIKTKIGLHKKDNFANSFSFDAILLLIFLFSE